MENRFQGEKSGDTVGLLVLRVIDELLGGLSSAERLSTIELFPGFSEELVGNAYDCFDRNSFNNIRASSPSGPVKLNNL